MAVTPLSPRTNQPKDIGEIIATVKGKSVGPLTDKQAIKILAGALEDHISYPQAQQALSEAGFKKSDGLGGAVHKQIEADTREAQGALKQLGFLVGTDTVDGKRGEHTIKALQAFQRSCSPPIKADGVMTPETKAALIKARDRDTLAWAREKLPEAQLKYDQATGGKTHLGFNQQTIATMSDHIADIGRIDRPMLIAARDVAKLEAAISHAERGDTSLLAGVALMREFREGFGHVLDRRPAADANGDVRMPEQRITR